jgi:hypothetical protein
MSNIPLSPIQEIIERSLFERLRLECVDKGYLPDITTFPETPAGQIAYSSAVNAIATAGQDTFAIELFQNSSAHAKGMKRSPRIVINPQPFMEGSLGGDSSRVFTYNGTTYDVTILPPQTSEYFFNVHLVSSSGAQNRILNALMSLSIPVRGYIPLYNSPTENLFVRKLSGFNAPQTDEGIQETVYRFQIPDIFETCEQIVATGVSGIKEITVNTFIKSPDGTNTPVDPYKVEAP